MTAHGLLVVVIIGLDATILGFVLLRVRQLWNKSVLAAMAMAFIVAGAAIAGGAYGARSSLLAAVALWAFVLAHPLIVIGALSAFHGEDLPRRWPAVLLILVIVPVVALFATADGAALDRAYTDLPLNVFLATCFAVGLAEALYTGIRSPVLASAATWVGTGIVILIVAGPVLAFELDSLGLPSEGSLILGSPLALVAFTVAFARTNPFAIEGPAMRRGASSDPGIVQRGVAFVFDEERPKNMITTVRRDADRGRPALVLARSGPLLGEGAGGIGFSEIHPTAHAGSRALATAREFLAKTPGGLLAIPDIASIAALCGWPESLDLIRHLIRISRQTDSTLLLPTALLRDCEREDLRELRLPWWILPDPAVEVDAILRAALGAAGGSLFDGFLKTHGLARETFTSRHVPALAGHLDTATKTLASQVSDPHVPEGLRDHVTQVTEALREFSTRSALDLSQGAWPSHKTRPVEDEIVVTAMDYWRGKEPEEGVQENLGTGPVPSLYDRVLSLFTHEFGPTGESLLRFELRKLGRNDNDLRPADLKRLADRVDVDLATMVEIVDVPEARRRLLDRIGAIRQQMGLIEEEVR